MGVQDVKNITTQSSNEATRKRTTNDSAPPLPTTEKTGQVLVSSSEVSLARALSMIHLEA